MSSVSALKSSWLNASLSWGSGAEYSIRDAMTRLRRFNRLNNDLSACADLLDIILPDGKCIESLLAIRSLRLELVGVSSLLLSL